MQPLKRQKQFLLQTLGTLLVTQVCAGTQRTMDSSRENAHKICGVASMYSTSVAIMSEYSHIHFIQRSHTSKSAAGCSNARAGEQTLTPLWFGKQYYFSQYAGPIRSYGFCIVHPLAGDGFHRHIYNCAPRSRRREMCAVPQVLRAKIQQQDVLSIGQSVIVSAAIDSARCMPTVLALDATPTSC